MFNIFRVFLGSVFPKVFIFVFNILAARTLPVEEFGYYSYVKSFYNYFESIVSSALNPFAISKLVDKTFSKIQFLQLYFLYSIVSAALAVTFLFLSDQSVELIIVIILFGSILGSVLNAFLYSILVVDSKGHVIMVTTSITSLILIALLLVLNINDATIAIFIALSFNVIDFILKLVYYLSKKGSFFTLKKVLNNEVIQKNLPIKRSLYMMFALMLNGAVFLMQRYMLMQKTEGLQELAYLEVTMQLYAIITILLTAFSNGVMGQKRIQLYKFNFSSVVFMFYFCVAISVSYIAIIIYFNGYISQIYKMDYGLYNVYASCGMIFSYALAFFSVRLLIINDNQKYNFFSTVIAAPSCFLVYIAFDVSSVSIAYSYTVFYFVLCIVNTVFNKASYDKKNIKA